MSRRFRSDDTVKWKYGFGKGAYDATIGTETASWNGSTRFQTQAAITATAGATSFTKPAGWSHTGFCLLHQTRGAGAGNYELAFVDFSGANAVVDEPLQHTYVAGAQIITLSNGFTGYNNVSITGTLSPTAWDGSKGGVIAILAKSSISISGSINVSGSGFFGGSQVSGSGVSGLRAEGQAAAGGTTSTSRNENAGGGGSTSGLDGGGGGGGGANGANATAGTNDQATGGQGGTAVGNAELTSMVFGGGGGSGGAGRNGANIGGAGGKGGGIVILISREINITGSINLNGTAGANPAAKGGSGGGGAGGSCLLKCQTAVLGSNKITASAGAGGADGGSGQGGGGGAGSVGRIHIDYSSSYSGSTTPSIDARQDLTIKPVGAGNMLLAF